jgi:hypothetical protein
VDTAPPLSVTVVSHNQDSVARRVDDAGEIMNIVRVVIDVLSRCSVRFTHGNQVAIFVIGVVEIADGRSQTDKATVFIVGETQLLTPGISDTRQYLLFIGVDEL